MKKKHFDFTKLLLNKAILLHNANLQSVINSEGVVLKKMNKKQFDFTKFLLNKAILKLNAELLSVMNT
eukprot:CAMPEP_0201550426 /NCGR_PEP_ID=MMETSP0173_2-20130828/6784_1 /ASSEMBLY_ACC=CAM_ASM_000268 /TAXON_ID=218659 /ORGANISM="Vexillifera sp., Strain DIVA3 564/2" /LENGTH=67 /DNA_ID=CAMNT_0047960387 /DNA_START=1 /DNA_END=201 /DNA_ORIENTATION=-